MLCFLLMDHFKILVEKIVHPWPFLGLSLALRCVCREHIVAPAAMKEVCDKLIGCLHCTFAFSRGFTVAGFRLLCGHDNTDIRIVLKIVMTMLNLDDEGLFTVSQDLVRVKLVK